MNKYISLNKLSIFLHNLRNTFASIMHVHKLEDITDYIVDTELSPTSTNPVENKTIQLNIYNVLTEAKLYTDAEIAALVNSAPETLDTIGELAAAFEENAEVVEVLDASITNKQDKISDTLILVDAVTGQQHKIQIQNGQLVSFLVE